METAESSVGAALMAKSSGLPRSSAREAAASATVPNRQRGRLVSRRRRLVGHVSTAGSSNFLRSRPVPEARNATVPERKQRGTVVQKKKKRRAGHVSTAESGKLPNRKLARAACHVSVPEMKQPEIAPEENQQPDRRRRQLADPKISCR